MTRLVAALFALITVGLLAAVAWQQATAGDGQCPGGTVVYVKDGHQCAPRSQWEGQP